MKLTKRIPALLLAAVLALSLASCALIGNHAGGDGNGAPPANEDATPTPPPPEEEKPDPRKILGDAAETTAAEIKARLDSTAIPKLLGLIGSDALTASFDIGFPDENGEVSETVSGTLVYRGGEARANAEISTTALSDHGGEAVSFPAELYYGPDLLAVSSPELLGAETFYGVAPRNVTGQLTGTPAAKILDLDDAALTEIDKALAELTEERTLTSPGFLDGVRALLTNAVEGKELSLTEDAGSYIITAPLAAEETEKLISDISALLPDSISQISVDGGDVFSQRLDAIGKSAGAGELGFVVRDGRTVSVSLSGAEPVASLSLYGDSGTQIALDVPSLLSLTLETGGGLKLDAAVGDQSPSITSLTWDSDGTFNFITYRNDVTDLALEGTALAEDGRASFDGIWFVGERGDRNPLSFTATSGGEVARPGEIKYIGELTEMEIAGLTLRLLRGFSSR